MTLLLLTGAVTAFGQLPIPGVAQPTPASVTTSSSDAPIGPRDRLDIRVAQDPNLSATMTVLDDGTIVLGFLGRINVAGLTPSQVEALIKTKLEAKFITHADVTVLVVEAGSKPISVVGRVMRPGPINVTGNITLVQAITQAGGLGQDYGKELYVLRTGQNGLTERIAIDIEDLLVNGNPDLNLPLAPNDVVNVPADTPITIYVLGEVIKPGVVQFRRSQSPMLLQALAGAGSLTDRASSKIVIKRMVNGQETTINADYKKITRGRAADVPLQDNDTVFVGESVF